MDQRDTLTCVIQYLLPHDALELRLVARIWREAIDMVYPPGLARYLGVVRAAGPTFGGSDVIGWMIGAHSDLRIVQTPRAGAHLQTVAVVARPWGDVCYRIGNTGVIENYRARDRKHNFYITVPWGAVRWGGSCSDV